MYDTPKIIATLDAAEVLGSVVGTCSTVGTTC
jgi:hypothetical protein